MKFKLQLVNEMESGTSSTILDIATIERGELCLENLGLKLTEAKEILTAIQQKMVQEQIEAYHDQSKQCPECQSIRHSKGSYSVTFRSLFGNVVLDSPRLHNCGCAKSDAKTFSPLSKLLPQHAAPELVYMEAKWSSLVSYELAASLLKDVLPVSIRTNAATVRNHTHAVAERCHEQSNSAAIEQCNFAGHSTGLSNY